jgi:hypothetical protein
MHCISTYLHSCVRLCHLSVCFGLPSTYAGGDDETPDKGSSPNTDDHVTDLAAGSVTLPMTSGEVSPRWSELGDHGELAGYTLAYHKAKSHVDFLAHHSKNGDVLMPGEAVLLIWSDKPDKTGVKPVAVGIIKEKAVSHVHLCLHLAYTACRFIRRVNMTHVTITCHSYLARHEYDYQHELQSQRSATQ